MSQAAQRYHVFETAMGFCAIAWSDAGNRALSIAGKERRGRRTIDPAPGFWRRAGSGPGRRCGRRRRGEAVFRRRGNRLLDVRLDLGGEDAFFTRIYAALRRVGWGRTTTYGALAKEVGAGREAARDVGEAMAKIRRPSIIPCHRVLAVGGKIGGFSAPGGSTTKMRMLELEGVRVGPPEAAQQALNF